MKIKLFKSSGEESAKTEREIDPTFEAVKFYLLDNVSFLSAESIRNGTIGSFVFEYAGAKYEIDGVEIDDAPDMHCITLDGTVIALCSELVVDKTPNQIRLASVQKRLEEMGTKKISLSWVEGAEKLSVDERRGHLCDFLESFLDGKCKEMHYLDGHPLGYNRGSVEDMTNSFAGWLDTVGFKDAEIIWAPDQTDEEKRSCLWAAFSNLTMEADSEDQRTELDKAYCETMGIAPVPYPTNVDLYFEYFPRGKEHIMFRYNYPAGSEG